MPLLANNDNALAYAQEMYETLPTDQFRQRAFMMLLQTAMAFNWYKALEWLNSKPEAVRAQDELRLREWEQFAANMLGRLFGRVEYIPENRQVRLVLVDGQSLIYDVNQHFKI